MFGLKKYIYCSVAFDNGRSYYYRTVDSNIQSGTRVVVPVGKYNAQKIVTIVSVGTYGWKDAPYPVRKTKEIIRTAGKNDERKVERYNKRLYKKIEREQNKAVKKMAERNRKQIELEWIDRIEEFDALFND